MNNCQWQWLRETQPPLYWQSMLLMASQFFPTPHFSDAPFQEVPNGANPSILTPPPHFQSYSHVYSKTGELTRNRFGRPYVSGRPLLASDRQRIIQLYQQGMRKMCIARSIGVTHSCVSKVIRKFETGVENCIISLDGMPCHGSQDHDGPSQMRNRTKLLSFHSNNENFIPKDFSPRLRFTENHKKSTLDRTIPFSVDWRDF